ncbi:MAG: hypothetical protein HOP19_04775, partial [Acidobacteria bacterium]|nr:hypothetical protein [Acidobacteriota bacterium]
MTTNLTIAARGYYLIAGSAYSLTSVAADENVPALPNGSALAGVLLCNATNAVLDAVGTTDLNVSQQTQFGEGTLLTALGVVLVEHAWVRKAIAGSGLPQDTQNNANDFALVATASAPLNGVTPALGAPGPQNSASPLVNNAGLPLVLLNPAISPGNQPNSLVENVAVTMGTATYPRSLYLRRTLTNNMGKPVTRLRFRIMELSNGGVNTAILRALSSSDITVNGLPVKGLTLDQLPTQPTGGGLNSTLSAGVVTLAAPLAAGA